MAMAVPATAPTLMLNRTRFTPHSLISFDRYFAWRLLYDPLCFQFNDEEALSQIYVFQYVSRNEGKAL